MQQQGHELGVEPGVVGFPDVDLAPFNHTYEAAADYLAVEDIRGVRGFIRDHSSWKKRRAALKRLKRNPSLGNKLFS